MIGAQLIGAQLIGAQLIGAQLIGRQLGGVVLHRVGGERHEDVLEGSLVRDQGGECDVCVTCDAPDRRGIEATDGDGFTVARTDLDAVTLEAGHECAEVIGTHDRLVAGGHLTELGGRHVGDQATPANDHEVLGHQFHLAHEVRRHEHGTTLFGQPLEQVADPQDALRVEAVDRLVEHHHFRVPEECGGDAEALSHAEREAATAATGHIGQADQAEHFLDPCFADAVGDGQRHQVVVGGALGVDRSGIEQRAERSERRGVLGQRPAVDERRPRGGGIEPENHPHRGRLAGAVRAEEAGDDAGLDGECQVVDGGGLAVALGELVDLDHGAIVRLADVPKHLPEGGLSTTPQGVVDSNSQPSIPICCSSIPRPSTKSVDLSCCRRSPRSPRSTW